MKNICDVIAPSPRMGETSEIVDRMGRAVKGFDELEQKEGYRCVLCNHWFPADEIFVDDEHGDLCKKHFDEVEAERELAEEERVNHHK